MAAAFFVGGLARRPVRGTGRLASAAERIEERFFMRAEDRPHRSARRQFQPALEGLEIRELPSTFRVVGEIPGKHRPPTLSLNLIVASEPGRGSGSTGAKAAHAETSSAHARPPWVSESLLQSLVGQLYGPITTTTPIQVGSRTFPPGTYSVPQPTPREIQRETFWLEFVGHYSVGPPRFSNQSSTIHIFSNGRSVTSNQFLNGRAQILLFPPSNPAAMPTTDDPIAGQITGMFTAIPANALQSSSILFSQVTNLPGVSSNDPSALDHGLPSRIQFRIDPGGVSGGLYGTPAFSTTPATITNPATGQPLLAAGGSGGAVAFNQGAGMIEIKYLPTNHLRAGASQSGTVIVRVQGLINTTGVMNALYKPIN
jgi:hypothetical protein